jgi:DNA mismatch endonuclease, patch repair protein
MRKPAKNLESKSQHRRWIARENPKVRSATMRNVRAKGNRSTEWRLRASLASRSISGWTVQGQKLPGRPDFVFLNSKIVVFVDGCFWHGCKQCYRRPKTSRQYWDQKLFRNMRRAKYVNHELMKDGWNVLRIWEHELRDLDFVIRKIRREIGSA